MTEGKPGQGESYEIVGVVETGKYRTLGENPRPVVFRPRLGALLYGIGATDPLTFTVVPRLLGRVAMLAC